MKNLLLIPTLLALGGCVYPTSSVEQGSPPAHLRIVDSPIGAEILIDGRHRGARMDAQPVTLDVAPGKHVVEEIASDQVVFHREYDVSAGATLEVRAEH